MLHLSQVEAALASDAAKLITSAVESAPDEFKIEAQEIQCDSDSQWEIGEEFTNHLLTVKMHDNGYLTCFVLQYFMLNILMLPTLFYTSAHYNFV